MPDGATAVVGVEDVQREGDTVRFPPVKLGAAIREIGTTLASLLAG